MFNEMIDLFFKKDILTPFKKNPHLKPYNLNEDDWGGSAKYKKCPLTIEELVDKKPKFAAVLVDMQYYAKKFHQKFLGGVQHPSIYGEIFGILKIRL